MAEELSYRRLCELVREEKSTNNLVTLAKDFEMSASSLIFKMHNDAQASSNVEAKREHENAMRLLSSLLRLRRQKVVFRALNEGHKHETAGMTEGDHALFDRVCGIMEEEDVRSAKVVSGKAVMEMNAAASAPVAAMANGEVWHAGDKITGEGNGGNGTAIGKGAENANDGENTVASEVRDNLKRLRIIKDVKAYRGADGSTVGPFKIGDEVPLPLEEADLLVRGRLAESIEN
jgi:DNA replication initiation complex subunit (GINS family)